MRGHEIVDSRGSQELTSLDIGRVKALAGCAAPHKGLLRIVLVKRLTCSPANMADWTPV
jgi:hypothetical protein